MRPLSSPAELDSAADALAAAGGTGFLLSGGCDRDGKVPLSPYLGAVRKIKERTDLRINLHTGLVGEEEARSLLSSGADAFSVDVLQDPRTIIETLHLQATPADYARTLRLLEKGRLVPHVCVGLQSEAGEAATIDLLSTIKISSIIVLGLVPSPGTPLANQAFEPTRVVRFIAAAARKLDVPILLGCMRPRSDRSLELEAIRAGASGIVNPSAGAVELARAEGLKVEEREECCALYR